MIVLGAHSQLGEHFRYMYRNAIHETVYGLHKLPSKSKIEIDDFYYEIVNDKTLHIKIDLILDNLM